MSESWDVLLPGMKNPFTVKILSTNLSIAKKRASFIVASSKKGSSFTTRFTVAPISLSVAMRRESNPISPALSVRYKMRVALCAVPKTSPMKVGNGFFPFRILDSFLESEGLARHSHRSDITCRCQTAGPLESLPRSSPFFNIFFRRG